jgi:hypothetical protein
MVMQSNRLEKKISNLEQKMNKNSNRPEFFGFKEFKSQEECDAFCREYEERNKGKFFRPGEISFVGFCMIMSNDEEVAK